MADQFYSGRRSSVLLFDEDFDLPPPGAEPEVIQPVYTASELMAAREQAAREARDTALAEAEADGRAAARLALTRIAEQLTAATIEMTALAEQSSEAIARLLLGCFATALPTLSARHGAAEVAAVMRAVLPTLRREPNITVRLNPHLLGGMTEELGSLDGDLAARVRLVPTDAVALGDVRIAWDNGSAIRDTASIWREIETVLTQAGLLNPLPSAHAASTAKEHALVE